MSPTKYTASLTVSTIMLSLTLSSSTIAEHRMGYDMMNDDDREEMMPWAGRHGKRDIPYMRGQHGRGMGKMMGMGNMMGMMPMLMHGLDSVNLNKQQRRNIRAILRDLRKKHWQTMEKNMDLSDELTDLYAERPLNANNIAAVYDRIFTQKKKMVIEMIEMRNKVDALLTDEQLKELESTQHRGMGYGMGFGMMH